MLYDLFSIVFRAVILNQKFPVLIGLCLNTSDSFSNAMSLYRYAVDTPSGLNISVCIKTLFIYASFCIIDVKIPTLKLQIVQSCKVAVVQPNLNILILKVRCCQQPSYFKQRMTCMYHLQVQVSQIFVFILQQ